MNFLSLDVPHRSAILYVRITPQNKEYIEELAREHDISTSSFINNLFSQVRSQREEHDSKKHNTPKKSGKASRR